jgi:hypothetical protein
VQGHEEDRGVVVEEGLGPVAVVDVPVEDQHLFRAVIFLHVFGRNRDAVEEAEAVRVVHMARVVPRGTHFCYNKFSYPLRKRLSTHLWPLCPPLPGFRQGQGTPLAWKTGLRRYR